MSADIGLIGLAVMGENLVLNMESKGFTVAVYNRTTSKVTDFVEKGRGKGKKIIGCLNLQELVKSIKTPRKIMIMVRAGDAVDSNINALIPLLEKGDIIIDGGNSHFPDSNRRAQDLKSKGLHFVGAGVSGGEEGALKGPSIMPGGAPEAWETLRPIFQGICAKTEDGTPCCDWVGEEGSGHYVKMVHNGIEYGDMQLICEAYHLLREVLGFSNEDLQKVFTEWNKGDLDSYLIEITAQIFSRKDDENPNAYVVDTILDSAGQKGTGKWTATSALDFGMPVTLIGEAVFARCLSALKDERVQASKELPPPSLPAFNDNKEKFISSIRDALYASKLVSYAQGFTLLRAAATEYNWNLNYGGIALMWRGGCIIRSKFLGKITEAYKNNPKLTNLLLDPFFKGKILAAQEGWRYAVGVAVARGIPVPAMATALSYYDGFRTANLPANLLQAQRDFFGAHTFERVDKPRGQYFHCNWTGSGGSTSSTSYNV
jgi:6-phosphogluconate dehydrogenase